MARLPGIWDAVLVSLAVAASMCLGAAGLDRRHRPVSRPLACRHRPPTMRRRRSGSGPLVLGAAGVVLGVLPALAAGPIALAGEVGDGNPIDSSHSACGTASPSRLLLSALTARGFGRSCSRARQRLWRLRMAQPCCTPSGSTTFTLAGLDALSRRVAPALQSASLRSYVLTVVVTAIALVTHRAGDRPQLFRRHAAGRRSSSTKRHLPRSSSPAALSAAFARSTMAAALSLGTVGYGVAVMYALLGAPDLAMTQFAVETLTVVIFVLVFSRLRGFGDLSSRLVKTRDAIVAVAAGALVTTLVLFVGASGTTSRLAAYFADAAPRLAHGRNVVNVILVDFRGFDTLGEMTVLVTVAIGVRALLLIGRERRQ